MSAGPRRVASDHAGSASFDLPATMAPPGFDPTPAEVAVSLDVVEAGVLPYRQQLAATVRQLAAEADVPHELLGEWTVAKPTPARVPEWVQNSVKWQAMTRAERRAVERHHRRQGGR